MVWSGINLLYQSIATKKWITTTGTLQDVRLVRESGAKSVNLYRVNVKYIYLVKSVPYQRNSLSYGYSASNDYDGHSKIYSKLKSAKKVEVRFNPANHNQSTLSYGADISSFFMIGFGATILMFMTLFAVVIYLSGQHYAGLLRSLVVLE
jgi:hypothetical protein